MDFEITKDGNNTNIKYGESSATCFMENTPKDKNGTLVGCIGNVEFKNTQEGKAILVKCEEIFKDAGFKKIVGPMNGNTWKKYRVLKQSENIPGFVLENVNLITDNEIFLSAGFSVEYEYTSTLGKVADAYDLEVLDMIEEQIEEEGIVLRNFRKDSAIEDLRKIYNVSRESFSRNPYYTDIDEENFIGQYTPYIDMVDESLIMIAEKEGKEVAFVFCIPNLAEMQRGEKIHTLILKTIAVLPEYEDLGIGNVMLRKIAKVAKVKGFEDWIFAFMFKENTSQKMAARNNSHIIREYVLYCKEI